MPQRLMGGFDRRWRDMAVKNSSCRLLLRLFVFLSSSIPSSPPPPLCLFPLLRSHLPRSGSAPAPPSWKTPGSPRTSCFQEAPVDPNFPAGGGGQTARGARRHSPHSWGNWQSTQKSAGYLPHTYITQALTPAHLQSCSRPYSFSRHM